MPSTTPLVRVYVDALCGRAIYVHAGLKGRAAFFGFEPHTKKDLFAKLWFARPAHAELVAMRCCQDFKAVGAIRWINGGRLDSGWVDLPPSEVVEKIWAVAAMLGARWQTQGDIERDAERAVAEITTRVKVARLNGGLKQVNMEYKMYRRAQMEKGEPAIPYSAHLAQFTRLLVLRAAQKSMLQTGYG
jgi:hypothetical protein